MNKFKC